MECKRHIVIGGLDSVTRVQVFEYDSAVAIWVGSPPDKFTPKIGKAAKGIVKTFVNSMLAMGCEVISDEPTGSA